MRDVHKTDHTENDLLVGHVRDVLDGRAVLLPTEPGLSEVLVELRDDFRTTLREPDHALLLGQLEDGVVELLPELDGARRDLVDGLAELGADSQNATGLLRVRALPLRVVDTGRGDDEILDGGAGVGLLRDHDTAGEQETVERHGLKAVLLNGPVTGEVRPDIVGTTETGATHEDKIGVLADRAIGREDGLVEVLARVVTSGATAGPLHDDGEVGVRSSDVDDLADTVDRAGLEGNMLDPGGAERRDDLSRLLSAGNSGGNTEALNGQALAAHLLPEWELEPELAGVDVERVESDTDTSGNLALDLGDLRAKGSGVVVTTTSKLSMVSSIENGADEARLHGRRRHTSDHDWRLAQEAREGRVDVDRAIAASYVNICA